MFVTAALLLAATAACSSSSSSRAGSGTITVLAASSLTKAFTKLGAEFEAAHSGAHVAFDFGSSSQLATQIVQP